VNWREAARSDEWAQHFSNASCFFQAIDRDKGKKGKKGKGGKKGGKKKGGKKGKKMKDLTPDRYGFNRQVFL